MHQCIFPKTFFLSVALLICINQLEIASQAGRDTLKANDFLIKARYLSDSALFDSSAVYYRMAAGEYRHAKQWERYFYCTNNSITQKRKAGKQEGLSEQAYTDLNLAKKKFGDVHTITGDCYNIIGNLLADANENDSALLFFGKAVEIWKSCGSEADDKIATGYKNIGAIYIDIGDYDSGTVYINKSLEIFRRLFDEDHEFTAGCYNSLGIIAYHMGDVDDCEKYFTKSVEIKEHVFGTSHPATAEAYNNLASLYEMTGDYQRALDLQLKAYRIRMDKLGPKHPMTALSLNNLGNVYHALGNIDKSLACHTRALEIRQEIFDSLHADLCMSYTNLGVLYRDMGMYLKSLYYFEKALHIQLIKFGLNNPYTASAYNNMGAIYASMGNYDESLKYLKKALELRKQKGECTPYVAGSYNNIGAIYKYKGDYELALAYYSKSIEIRKQLFGDIHPDIASTIDNIGVVMLDKEQADSARNCFKKSIEMLKQIYGEENSELASEYLNLGTAYAKLGDLDAEYTSYLTGLDLVLKDYGPENEYVALFFGNISTNFMEREFADSALFYQRKSIEIGKKIYQTKHPELAVSYRMLAEIFERLEVLDSARSYFIKALQTNYKDNLTMANPDMNNILDAVEFVHDLLNLAQADQKLSQVQKNYDYLDEAIVCFEKVRQLLPEIFCDFTTEETKIDLVNLISGKSQIAVSAAILLFKETGDITYRNKAFEFSELNKATVLQNVMYKCEAEVESDLPAEILQDKVSTMSYLDYLSGRMKKNSYENDSQRITDETRADSLVLRLKDIRETINEYLAGDDLLHDPLYGASIKDVRRKLAPDEALLSYFLADSSIYAFVITNDTMTVTNSPVSMNMEDLVEGYLSSIRKYESENYLKYSKMLYDLLISENLNYLKDKTSITIIPDKCLLYLPFETLTSSDRKTLNLDDFSEIKYLVSDFDIRYHYSTGLWLKNKEIIPAQNKNFLGFAPVFTDIEKEYPNEATGQKYLTSITDKKLVRSVSKDGVHFSELPYTRLEIDSLKTLFEEDGYNTDIYLYDIASEENFKRDVAGHNFVHIATHGIVDSENAELSGIIFASPQLQSPDSPDEVISDLNDGILYAREIYNLDLNADLVVLSACETGLGKLEKGEGMMGLTRGFLYAGVPNIVYSYWKVGDQNSLEFMISFYKNVLHNKSYAQALRSTKLTMISNSDTSFPFFWGGFALIGE